MYRFLGEKLRSYSNGYACIPNETAMHAIKCWKLCFSLMYNRKPIKKKSVLPHTTVCSRNLELFNPTSCWLILRHLKLSSQCWKARNNFFYTIIFGGTFSLVINNFVFKHNFQELSIQNSITSNGHHDLRLINLIQLVHEGFSKVKWSEEELNSYQSILQRHLKDFTHKFIPHMKEEEEVRILFTFIF